MQPLSWQDAQTFLAVAETGSFSDAARRLKLGQPTVSRRIQRLEQRLGQQLFTRGKHGAVQTQAAERIYPAALQMSKWATEFDHRARDVSGQTQGVVKVACPPGLAVERLAPFAAWLADQDEGISLDVLAAIDHVDLTRGVADLAIRTQYPTEPELTVLHECETRPGIYGSPEYLSKIDCEPTWDSLDWVTWSDRYRHVTPRPMLERLIADFTPALMSDDYLVQKAVVKAGLGVMICTAPGPTEAAQLQKLDIGTELPVLPLYIVCARSMQQVPILRRLVALMVANLFVTGQT